MKWGPSFADLCYRKHICLKMWPRDWKAPGSGLTEISQIPLKGLKAAVDNWIDYWRMEKKKLAAAKVKDNDDFYADDDDDQVEVTKSSLIHFNQWDNGR